MVKKLITWNINYIGKKGRHIGVVRAPEGDPDAAIRKGAEEFGIVDPENQKRLAAQPILQKR